MVYFSLILKKDSLSLLWFSLAPGQPDWNLGTQGIF